MDADMWSIDHLIAPNPPMTVDAYLATTAEPVTSTVRRMLSVATTQMIITHAHMGLLDDPPELRVEDDDTINGAAMAGRVLLTRGLVQHCSTLTVPCTIIEELGITIGVSPVLQDVALTFSLLHEFSHVARKHNESATFVGDSLAISQAMEHDADMCAAAAVYRLLQSQFSRLLNDKEVRDVALVCIIWFLLRMPTAQEGGLNGRLAERLYYVFSKLFSIREDIYAHPDPNCQLPETLQMAEYLTKTFGKLLKLEDTLFPEEHPNIGIQVFNVILNKQFPIVKAWDGLRTTVANISQTEVPSVFRLPSDDSYAACFS
jgi:hypothetical protein